MRRWQELEPRRRTAILAGAVFAAALVYQLSALRYEDTVKYRYDDLTYQYLAVNIARGHGYQIGPVTDIADYRFTNVDPTRLEGREEARPHYKFGRTPGYPAFVAMIYWVVGVHPVS